jgi:hypothetical protein
MTRNDYLLTEFYNGGVRNVLFRSDCVSSTLGHLHVLSKQE